MLYFWIFILWPEPHEPLAPELPTWIARRGKNLTSFLLLSVAMRRKKRPERGLKHT
jgi:hypothetical protein